jgi:hypothetical protein
LSAAEPAASKPHFSKIGSVTLATSQTNEQIDSNNMNEIYTRIMPHFGAMSNRALHFCSSILCCINVSAAPPDENAAFAAWKSCRMVLNGEIGQKTSRIGSVDDFHSASVLLRLDGQVLGVGSARSPGAVATAFDAAIEDANRRWSSTPSKIDKTIPFDRVTLELEVGGEFEPLLGTNFAQAAREVQPALDGMALRRGSEWAVAHPGVLQALNAASAPDQTLLSLALQVGLPARDLDQLPADERVAIYRFEATRVVQPTFQSTPVIVQRGMKLVPAARGTQLIRDIDACSEGIVAWFERSLIASKQAEGDQPAAQQSALRALGLRGDYLPAERADATLFAGAAEQALAAAALAKFAQSNGGLVAQRAAAVSAEILCALGRLDAVETDPRTDAKAVAWIVMACTALPKEVPTCSELASIESDYRNALLARCNRTIQAVAPGLANEAPATPLTLAGDPLEQALLLAALASCDRAGEPLVERATLIATIDKCWRDTPRGVLVGVFGWLLEADLALGSVPSPHQALILAARQALFSMQMGSFGFAAAQIDPPPPDVHGAFALSGQSSRGANAQSARPGHGLALMLGNAELTSDADVERACAAQALLMRFLRQLIFDDTACYLVAERTRAFGAVRTAPWDSRIAVAANAMCLICLEESRKALQLRCLSVD